ncbi:dodecin family protein [Brevundimonas sp. NPDC058933]|uniref:dodecin family protein n=1 Tax=Brevundimonas sp. NPDC058933 TaxID=3346673 RepID=UPI003BEEEC65
MARSDLFAGSSVGVQSGRLATLAVQEALPMSIARVTEITASSTVSFDDAIAQGIARADKTLRHVEGAWIQEQKVVVREGKIAEYRVNMKVTFVLAD